MKNVRTYISDTLSSFRTSELAQKLCSVIKYKSKFITLRCFSFVTYQTNFEESFAGKYLNFRICMDKLVVRKRSEFSGQG